MLSSERFKMIIKKVFNAPMTWRNLLNFPPQISIHKFSHSGTGQVTSPENVHDVDPLLAELNGPFTSKSLSILDNNVDKLNGSHIVAAMNSYLRLYKKILSNSKNKELTSIEDDSFEKLCSLINCNIEKLSGSDAAKISESLIRLKIPDNSLLVQSILKYIYNSVDNLSIKDFNLISKFIHKMNTSDMVKKLKKKLSNKFISKVKSGLQENNIDDISHALAFISNNYSSSRQSQLLSIVIKKFESHKGEIPATNLLIILKAICTMQWYPYGWVDLSEKVLNEMISKVNEFNVDHINYTLFHISNKIHHHSGKHVLYNENLINVFVQKLIDEDVGFDNGIGALRSLHFMRYKSTKLLNYCCASYFEKFVMKDQQIKIWDTDFLTLVGYLAIAKHRSPFWKDILDIFSNNFNVPSHSYKTLSSLALSLMILDHYPIHILEKLFDGKYEFLQDSYAHWNIVKIYQAIKSNPNYDGPMPPETLIQSMKELHTNYFRQSLLAELPLEKYFQESLEGYVISRIGTKLFHTLDHVVVFDKHKSPVPVNLLTNTNKITKESNNQIFIEDLNIPSHCKLVSVNLYPNKWFFRNCDELLGAQTVPVATLKGVNSVIIQAKDWYSIPEDKKASFLMNEIKSKL